MRSFNSWLQYGLELYCAKRELELSKNGFKSLVNHLKSFDNYVEHNCTKENIDESDVAKWIKSLSNLADLADGTINNYISDIRQFLAFENSQNGTHHFIPDLRNEIDTYVPHYFDDSERKQIYTYADDYPSLHNNHMIWIKAELPMILRIMEGCGTRISEILCLKMMDIDLVHNIIIIRKAKDNKQRYLPISESLGNILHKYCKAMGIIDTPDAYLFPGRTRNEHLRDSDIRSRFNQVLRYAGIVRDKLKHTRNICLYNFRHTFAIRSFQQLENQGIHLDDSVPYLSIYMGHVGLKETEKYLKFSAELFPEEIDKFDNFTVSVLPQEDLWEKWSL